jgi:pimeloyl-ACP methyl ester carboxylesterase
MIKMANPENITLKTSDDQVIKGIYYPNSMSKKGILLLHQLAKNKDSWKQWIPELGKTHNVLAIDLRGHGESSGDYKDFSDDDFNAIKKDVAASVEMLERKGHKQKTTFHL